MKKSHFVALVMGTVSGVLFALGMCMALLPEWDSLREGVILGVVGVILGIATVLVWRRMEGRKCPPPNARTLFLTAYVILAALVLGIGMCLCLVAEQFVWGTLVGLAGIAMLLALIPMVKGLR